MDAYPKTTPGLIGPIRDHLIRLWNDNPKNPHTVGRDAGALALLMIWRPIFVMFMFVVAGVAILQCSSAGLDARGLADCGLLLALFSLVLVWTQSRISCLRRTHPGAYDGKGIGPLLQMFHEERRQSADDPIIPPETEEEARAAFVAVTLQRERMVQAWTQENLAVAAGVSVRTIQRAEKTGKISAENLRALCSVLKIDIPKAPEPTVQQTLWPQAILERVQPRTLKHVESFLALVGFVLFTPIMLGFIISSWGLRLRVLAATLVGSIAIVGYGLWRIAPLYTMDMFGWMLIQQVIIGGAVLLVLSFVVGIAFRVALETRNALVALVLGILSVGLLTAAERPITNTFHQVDKHMSQLSAKADLHYQLLQAYQDRGKYDPSFDAEKEIATKLMPEFFRDQGIAVPEHYKSEKAFEEWRREIKKRKERAQNSSAQ